MSSSEDRESNGTEPVVYLKKYRESVQEYEQRSQAMYDRTILSLSGGALVLTLGYVGGTLPRDTLEGGNFLLTSWICWVISILLVLASSYFNILALRKTVDQIDDGTIEKEHAGGCWDKLNAWIGPFSGILFLIGVILMIVFVICNTSVKTTLGESHGLQEIFNEKNIQTEGNQEKDEDNSKESIPSESSH